MELSEIRGGHFIHMNYGSEINLSVIVDDFGNAVSTSNLENRTFLDRFIFLFEGRNAD